MANSFSRPSPTARTSPSRGFTRAMLVSLIRSALLLGAAGALATVSLAAAVLALTAGSALVLAWVYRKPWPLGWLTGLPPLIAAALAVVAQTALPLPDLGALLLPGAGVGAVVGLLAGFRHRVQAKGGLHVAGPVWGLVLLWGAGLLAGQATAMSGETEAAGFGVAAAGFTSALLAGFFLVLLVRRLTGGAASSLSAASLLACLVLGLAIPGLAQEQGAGHDVGLQDVVAGRVRGLSVRLTGGEGFASGRLIAHFSNDAGRTFRVGVPPGLLFRPLNASDPPDMRSSSYHVLDVPPGSGAHQIQASPVAGYEAGGECTPRMAPSPTRPNVLVGVACPLPHHEYGIAGVEGAGVDPGRDALDPGFDPGVDPGLLPPPDSYVPRHLLVEAGEEAGALIGLSVLLAGLIGSIGLGVTQGASPAAGSSVLPTRVEAGEESSLGAVPPESPVSEEGPMADSGATSRDAGFLEELLAAIRGRRIDWLASGGQLPDPLAGSPPQTPWGGEGYRTWRGAMEAVDRAVQRTRDPDDVHDPTRIKQEEMEDYHRYETMRRGNQAGRAVRAVTAGAGDVASDPKPGLRTALTGGLHSLWDALGPDPTNIPEGLVDPQSEYRDLVEAWRNSQSWSRWLRTRTPGKPSDIGEMIRALRDERHAEEMARIGDDEYFAHEARKWDEELRRLRAIEDWLGRAGDQP